MKNKLIEAFGWYGAGAIILAYAMVSFSLLSATSMWYQVLNGTGAIGIVLVSLSKKNYQPAALNAVWAIVAVAALMRLIFWSL